MFLTLGHLFCFFFLHWFVCSLFLFLFFVWKSARENLQLLNRYGLKEQVQHKKENAKLVLLFIIDHAILAPNNFDSFQRTCFACRIPSMATQAVFDILFQKWVCVILSDYHKEKKDKITDGKKMSRKGKRESKKE